MSVSTTKTKQMFRTDVSRGIILVDRKNDIIKGFSVVIKGVVKDERGEFDEDELKNIVTMGNKTKKGIKSRFGHPNMSVTALGTFLGRVKNFRLDKDIVRADLHIDPTAHKTPDGDLATYVMDLAKSDPDAFGTSMVIKWDPEFRVNKKGERLKDENDNELPPLIKVSQLWSVDVVDDPAANEGMFGNSFFSEDVMLSSNMTQFLNKFLDNPEAIDKTISFLQRYATNDGIERTNGSLDEIIDQLFHTARGNENGAPADIGSRAKIFGWYFKKSLECLNKGGDNFMTDEIKETKPETPKAEVKEEPKAKVKEAPKAEVKEAPKAEVKEAPKAEVKEAPKAEVKEAPKAEVKEAPTMGESDKKFSQKDMDLALDKAVKPLETKVQELNGTIKSLEADKEVDKRFSEKYANSYEDADIPEVKRILKKNLLGQSLTLEETELMIDKKIAPSELPGHTAPVVSGTGLSEARKSELRIMGGLKEPKKT